MYSPNLSPPGDDMIRLASDERLKELAGRARQRIETEGDYWTGATIFLEGLIGCDSVTSSQHNWLSGLKTELSEVGD